MRGRPGFTVLARSGRFPKCPDRSYARLNRWSDARVRFKGLQIARNAVTLRLASDTFRAAYSSATTSCSQDPETRKTAAWAAETCAPVLRRFVRHLRWHDCS
jgi:hypothetical protein